MLKQLILVYRMKINADSTCNSFCLSFCVNCISGTNYILGLLTVNLAHELMKTYEHKYILIATICLSWISLFSAQWVVENVFEATTEMSILIDLIGGSYFIYLLVRRRNAQ